MEKGQLRKIIRESIKELMAEQPQRLNENIPCCANVSACGSHGDDCFIQTVYSGGMVFCEGTWDCTSCVRKGDCTHGGGGNIGTTDDPLKNLNTFALAENNNFGTTSKNLNEIEECCDWEGHTCYITGPVDCIGKWSCDCTKCICNTGTADPTGKTTNRGGGKTPMGTSIGQKSEGGMEFDDPFSGGGGAPDFGPLRPQGTSVRSTTPGGKRYKR